jgi:hypothetical protein
VKVETIRALEDQCLATNNYTTAVTRQRYSKHADFLDNDSTLTEERHLLCSQCWDLKSDSQQNLVALGNNNNNNNNNSVALVRERTIPTERPPLVGEMIANFCG